MYLHTPQTIEESVNLAINLDVCLQSVYRQAFRNIAYSVLLMGRTSHSRARARPQIFSTAALPASFEYSHRLDGICVRPYLSDQSLYAISI